MIRGREKERERKGERREIQWKGEMKKGEPEEARRQREQG